MIIEESDFRLTSIDDNTPIYDLEFLKIINKGKSNERSEFKIEAYGVTLESAIRRIAHYRIAKKQQDNSLKLLAYVKRLNSEIKSLLSTIDE
jgi:succinylglutamate desuccinylase